jgi:hypothetical protein
MKLKRPQAEVTRHSDWGLPKRRRDPLEVCSIFGWLQGGYLCR